MPIGVLDKSTINHNRDPLRRSPYAVTGIFQDNGGAEGSR